MASSKLKKSKKLLGFESANDTFTVFDIKTSVSEAGERGTDPGYPAEKRIHSAQDLPERDGSPAGG